MAAALDGLKGRGHDVRWVGTAPSSQAAIAALDLRSLMATRADIVAGGAAAPFPTAALGWLAGAHVMVLELSADQVARWNPIDRWAWQSLHATGLLDERDAADFQARVRGLERERIGLWPTVAETSEPGTDHPDTEVLERACERALARHRGLAPRPAIFLDRDGTLIRERGYLGDPAGLELLPGVARALRNLREAGYPLVVISNQSGVGRGMFTVRRVHEVMAQLRERLREHGVELDSIRFCPHRPDENCPCRKPRPGLLELAAEDLMISLRDSFAIGDKRLDVAAGHAAGARGILVRTGYGHEEETLPPIEEAAPDRVCDDLAEAAEWILRREEAGE
jgi:histidinol-phosphate phosphatase family protein